MRIFGLVVGFLSIASVVSLLGILSARFLHWLGSDEVWSVTWGGLSSVGELVVTVLALIGLLAFGLVVLGISSHDQNQGS